MPERTQIRRGVGLAAAAALSFGATVPLLKRASAGVGVFAAGSLNGTPNSMIAAPARIASSTISRVVARSGSPEVT